MTLNNHRKFYISPSYRCNGSHFRNSHFYTNTCKSLGCLHSWHPYCIGYYHHHIRRRLHKNAHHHRNRKDRSIRTNPLCSCTQHSCGTYAFQPYTRQCQGSRIRPQGTHHDKCSYESLQYCCKMHVDCNCVSPPCIHRHLCKTIHPPEIQ